MVKVTVSARVRVRVRGRGRVRGRVRVAVRVSLWKPLSAGSLPGFTSGASALESKG